MKISHKNSKEAIENRSYVIDLETGGLDPYKNGIVSLCLKRLGFNDPKENNTFYIKPKKNKLYSYEAWKTNRISLHDLTNNKVTNSLRVALDYILLNLFTTKTITLIGHNIDNFDIKFLYQGAREENVTLPPIFTIDTMALAKRHLKDPKILKSVSLETVTNYFLENPVIYDEKTNQLRQKLVEKTNFHDAEYDVVACEFIYHNLIKLETAEEEKEGKGGLEK